MITTLIVATIIAVTTPIPEIPPLLQPVVWIIVGSVLAFGMGGAIVWLRGRAATAKNPAVKEALTNAADLLQKAKDAVGNGPGAEAVAGALEAMFHAHTVTLGTPHPDDPRAP